MSSRGLTIADLAKKSGAHYVMISNYLKGGKSGKLPSLKTLIRLAQALHCSLEELTGLPKLHGIEEKLPKLAESTQQIVDFLESVNDDDPNKQFIIDLIRLAKQRRESQRKDGETGNS